MAVGVEPGAYRPVLLLQGANGDHRLLPVWIGTAEANALALEQQGITGPRPMAHQLIGHVLTSFARHLEQVRITEVRDNIFYAELILDHDIRVSARVSDAVALALRLGIPIQAEDTVLDAAAVLSTMTRVEANDPAQGPAPRTRSNSSTGSSTMPPPRTSAPIDS